MADHHPKDVPRGGEERISVGQEFWQEWATEKRAIRRPRNGDYFRFFINFPTLSRRDFNTGSLVSGNCTAFPVSAAL